MLSAGNLRRVYSLDREYFNLLHTVPSTPEHLWQYDVYRPRDSTMVLYSKNGTPLASVGLRALPDTVGSIITTRADSMKSRIYAKADFQGMLNADRHRFEFIISNLTEYETLKIDIMKQNVAVEDTDPGAAKGALNQVNELHHYQSYAITGDQKDSRALILASLKEQLTVRQDEEASQKTEKPTQGAYFYIAVTPRDDAFGVIPLFADTHWDVADFIVIRRAVDAPSWGHTMELCSAEGFIPRAAGGRKRTEFASLESFERVTYARGCPIPASAEVAEVRDKSEGLTSDDVDNSLASRVESGEHVTISSNKTGFRYRYNVSSNVTGKLCCLGLSVAPGLRFGPALTNEEIRQAAEMQIKDHRENGMRVMLRELKVYASDHCCVCLEANVGVIFYRCGHKCCCNVCSQELKDPKCPICRAHITARLVN